MRTQSTSSLHFQRKICEFCSIRIAPVASRRALENIRPYLTTLITCRKTPPMRNGRIDWQAVAQACSIEDEMTAELKKNLRSGLEAIIRWLDKERPEEDDCPTVEVPSKKTKPAPVRPRQRRLGGVSRPPRAPSNESRQERSRAFNQGPSRNFQNRCSTGPRSPKDFNRR